MAAVLLTTTNPEAIRGDWWTDLHRLRSSALAGASAVHRLVNDPEAADIILFSDSRANDQSDVRNHQLAKRFPNRVFIFSTNDGDLPLLPGVYTSIEQRWYMPNHARPGFYIKVFDHDWIYPTECLESASFLFSFCGSFDTHPFRSRLAELKTSRSFIRDTSHDSARGFGRSAEEYLKWQNEYFQVMRESMFVLCPRGNAPSSYRIFEAMKAGRAPVIIADDWVPPDGPNWAECSLWIPERQLRDVPRLLEIAAEGAPRMGASAARAWDQWFSKRAGFQTVVASCVGLSEARQNLGVFQRYRPFLQLARPRFIRHILLRNARAELRRALGIRGAVSP